MSSDDAETNPVGLQAVGATEAPTVAVAQNAQQRAQMGDAYMESVATLEMKIRQAESLEERQQLRHQATDYLDSALQAYRRPTDLARAHLAKAVLLADVAREEAGELERLERVGQIFDHCQQALSIVHHSDQVSYQTLTGAHATAAGLLFGAREMVKDERTRQALDRMIWAHGEMFGESLAWDIRHQMQGNDLLFTTRVLGALEEFEEDPTERRELAQSQATSAATAAWILGRTANPGEARQAAELARQATERVAALNRAASQPPACHTCGSVNAPAHSFCIRCGMPLALERRAQGPNCPSCSAANRLGTQFCTRCGVALSQEGKDEL